MKQRVFVIGSVNQDIVVTVGKAPKPGETVFGTSISYFPGGKGANQAIAARRLGASVIFIGKVGRDAFGTAMSRYLEENELGDRLLKDGNSPTGTAVILVGADGENSITVIPGANVDFDFGEIRASFDGRAGDLMVLQNEISLTTGIELLHEARARNMTTFFNAAPATKLPVEALKSLDWVVVNEHEFEVFFDRKLPDIRDRALVIDCAKEAAEKYSLGIVLTLGQGGAIALKDGTLADVEGTPVKAIDTTGAGDCFVGALTAGMTEGMSLSLALEFANRAAALSVTRRGASSSFPIRTEVD
jgi:ribokinase